MSRPAPRGLVIALGLGAGVVSALGVGAELACAAGRLDCDGLLRASLSLSFEANLPTWYSAGLLWTAGLGLALCAAQTDQGAARRWWVLAALFGLMSLDEAIELHEHLGGAELHGLLYFSWVVPGALITAVFAGAYWSFWRELPPPTRRGFAWAFALYVGGALGMELPLGAWTEAHGDENLTYALLDAVEETLEIVGLSVFLVAIARHAELASHVYERGSGLGSTGPRSSPAP